MPWPFSKTSSERDDEAPKANAASTSSLPATADPTKSTGWTRWWPFSSKSNSSDRHEASPSEPVTSRISSVINQSSDSRSWPSIWHTSSTSTTSLTLTPPQTALLILTISTLSITTYRLRRYYFRHHTSALSLSPTFYTRRRTLPGLVTTVGDGDNFRLYHTPGGRLTGHFWLRSLVRTSNNAGYVRRWLASKERRLKGDETIHVRLAGVDAPELGHWGNATQPGAQEALEWLKGYVLGRRVRVTALKADQYNRVVGTARVWRFPWIFGRKDVSLEMLKAGRAGIYEANSGVEFGGYEDKYRAAEEAAKRKELGLWAKEMRGAESPREYKTRLKKEGEEGSGPAQRGEDKRGTNINIDIKGGKTSSKWKSLLSIFSSKKTKR